MFSSSGICLNLNMLLKMLDFQLGLHYNNLNVMIKAKRIWIFSFSLKVIEKVLKFCSLKPI